jgi:glycosyltransferase involved in cell wall biosynthesis
MNIPPLTIKAFFLIIFIFFFDIKSHHTYSYGTYFLNISEKIKQDHAILVVAYNRPEYLLQCIASIESNPESQYIPCIFVLDGGSESKQSENIELINASKIKQKIILKQPRNYGCPKNHIDAKRFALDWCNFKKVIVLEDDIIFGPTYFTFMFNLHAWAISTFDNIGVVQSWSYCFLPLSEKEKKLNVVQENERCWSFVTYCIDKKIWNKIKPILYRYELYIDEISQSKKFIRERSKPYLWKGVLKIRSWVATIIQKKNNIQSEKSTSLSSSYGKEFRSYLTAKDFAPNQDTIMGLSLFMNDLIKLKTIVNRAAHIGKIGITTTEETFFSERFDKIVLDVFNQDANIKNFILLKE